MKTATQTTPLDRLKKKAEKGEGILKKGTRNGVTVSEMSALLHDISISEDPNKAIIEAMYIMYNAGGFEQWRKIFPFWRVKQEYMKP